MQKPSIGRIVVIKGYQSNGQDEHPAIVNCVHGPAGDAITPDPYFMCNTTMFPDCGLPQSVTSVYVFQTREQAEGYRERNSGENFKPIVGFFPDRV